MKIAVNKIEIKGIFTIPTLVEMQGIFTIPFAAQGAFYHSKL